MNNKQAKALTPFVLRMSGGTLGAIGFIFLAYRMTVIGTALIGIGSLFIAMGEN